MTQLVIGCPQCGQRYQIAPASAGKQFQCKKCGAVFVAGTAPQPAFQAVSGARPATDPLASLIPAGHDPLASARPLQPASHNPNASAGFSKPVLLAAASASVLVIVVVLGLVLLSLFGGRPTPVAVAPPASTSSIPPSVATPGPPPTTPPALAQPAVASAIPVSAPGAPPVLPSAPNPAASVSLTEVLSNDPPILTRQLIEQFEEQTRLISSVHSIESAKEVADDYPAVTQRVYRLEAALRNRLVSDEQRKQLNEQFKTRLDAIRTKWASEFIRVTAIPGAYENMDPELAPHADLTPFPTDVDGLHRDALRALGNALEAARQVKDIRTARMFSAPYRVANARSAPAISRLRRELKLGVNGRNSPQIEALIKHQDEELSRIGKIPEAHALFSRGEPTPGADASVAASGVHVATLPRPADAESFFAQNPQAVVIGFSDVKDNADRAVLQRLIMLSTPPTQQSQSLGGGNMVMSPVADLEALLDCFDFAVVTVDRNSRVILLKPLYPLPDLSAAAAKSLPRELQSGDQLRVRNALIKLSDIKPGSGREIIGAELFPLLPLEPVQGQVVEALRRGWFGKEQISLVQQALPSIQDEGLRRHMVVGISTLPDLDPKTIGWISSFYPTEHHAVMECWQNIGPAAETYVHEYLNHPQHEKRKDAAKTLGYIGSKASHPLLEKLLSDKDRGVAEEAKKAIAEINKPDTQRDWYRRQQE